MQLQLLYMSRPWLPRLQRHAPLITGFPLLCLSVSQDLLSSCWLMAGLVQRYISQGMAKGTLAAVAMYEEVLPLIDGALL